MRLFYPLVARLCTRVVCIFSNVFESWKSSAASRVVAFSRAQTSAVGLSMSTPTRTSLSLSFTLSFSPLFHLVRTRFFFFRPRHTRARSIRNYARIASQAQTRKLGRRKSQRVGKASSGSPTRGNYSEVDNPSPGKERKSDFSSCTMMILFSFTGTRSFKHCKTARICVYSSDVSQQFSLYRSIISLKIN